MTQPKMNADLGEGLDDVDRVIMPFIDQANIACGGHAGDEQSIARCVALAIKHRVEIGAHPSYLDHTHFGRRSLDIDPSVLEQHIRSQVTLVAKACQSEGVPLSHIKAHGALYNDSMKRHELLDILMLVAKDFDCKLMLQALPDMRQIRARARHFGIDLIEEAFADRAYLSSGFLASRDQEGAVYEDLSTILAQANAFSHQQAVRSLDGSELQLHVDSLCVHGDNALALQALTAIYDELH